MSEIFKTRVEPTIETPSTPGPVRPEGKDTDEFHTQEAQERIDLFETEKGHKYSEDYFNMREISAGDFNVKMSLARIDKYVKSVIESKEYDGTITNYKSILNEIESKIGTERLLGKARLQKILKYIGLMQKTDKLKEIKDKFFDS